MVDCGGQDALHDQTSTLLGLGPMKVSQCRFVQPPDREQKYVRGWKLGVKIASDIFDQNTCNRSSTVHPAPGNG